MAAERVRLTEAQRRDLTALAERVEGLAGACRETDVLIVQALYPDIGPCEPHCAGDTPIFWNDPLYKKPCPPLTASLDAVVALIERELPGWAWKVGTCCVSDDGWVVPDFNCPKHGERLRKQFGDFAAGSPEDTGIDVDKRPSGNPAIALLAAFLRGYALHLRATATRHEAIAKRWLNDPEVREKMNAGRAALARKEG